MGQPPRSCEPGMCMRTLAALVGTHPQLLVTLVPFSSLLIKGTQARREVTHTITVGQLSASLCVRNSLISVSPGCPHAPSHTVLVPLPLYHALLYPHVASAHHTLYLIAHTHSGLHFPPQLCMRIRRAASLHDPRSDAVRKWAEVLEDPVATS